MAIHLNQADRITIFNDNAMAGKLILASSSIWKLALLKQIGYTPDKIVPADIDESMHKKESLRRLALRLAEEKAQKVALQFSEDYVLGADTVAGVGTTSLPKAITEEDAWFCINKLSGRRHRVYTAVCVAFGGKCASRVHLTIVQFKNLSDEEKRWFVTSRQWKDKAGGYGLQGCAAAFIKSLRGLDSTVVGLPLSCVYKLLSGAGLKPKLPSVAS